MNLTFLKTVVVLTQVAVIYSATRCYKDEGLGCFESAPMNALPQEPRHVRTTFTVTCRGVIDDVTIPATKTFDKQLLESSCFQAYRPTRLIVHGFTDSAAAQWVADMRAALLAQEDVNVIAVDWRHGAQFPYVQAVANTALVGRQVAHFLTELIRVQGLDPALIHIIGHSAGAQVAGVAGGEVVPRVNRITGLDPAEPYFGEMNDSRRLDKTDADFVDVIHTDGERFTGFKGYGSLRQQGHVDFYPNGGMRQPGCDALTDLNSHRPAKSPQTSVACSHAFAIPLFIASISRPINMSATQAAPTSSAPPTTSAPPTGHPSCRLTARPCASWAAYDAGNCTLCQGPCPELGLHVDLNARGRYFLSTAAAEPFCGTEYQVKVAVSPTQSHAYGRLYLSIKDGNSSAQMVDILRKDTHFHASDVLSHVITLTTNSPNFNNVNINFTKGSGLSALMTADTLALEHVTLIKVGTNDSVKLCSPPITKAARSQLMAPQNC